MICNLPYQPKRPEPGRYLIHIHNVELTDGCITLYYDIAVGPCAGYAYVFYLQSGKWPLVWRIRTNGGQTVLRHALRALSEDKPLSTILDAAGRNLTVDIGLYKAYLDVRRSYPASTYPIAPDDIRIGTTSWSAGTKDTIHAMLLAQLSGLPVLCADTHERESPMVDWCAKNNIILLPSTFPAGDYTMPNSDIIVDRKADISELYRDFASSADRVSYENAACYAAAMGKSLVYLIGISPDDHVFQTGDLRFWVSQHPKIRNKKIYGEHLYEQFIRYKRTHPNTDFRFIPHDRLYETIYNTVYRPIVSVPAQESLSA